MAVVNPGCWMTGHSVISLSGELAVMMRRLNYITDQVLEEREAGTSPGSQGYRSGKAVRVIPLPAPAASVSTWRPVGSP